jgi:hypothetical protein
MPEARSPRRRTPIALKALMRSLFRRPKSTTTDQPPNRSSFPSWVTTTDGAGAPTALQTAIDTADAEIGRPTPGAPIALQRSKNALLSFLPANSCLCSAPRISSILVLLFLRGPRYRSEYHFLRLSGRQARLPILLLSVHYALVLLILVLFLLVL